MEKPTQEQLEELRRLSKKARVDDWSEIVKSKEEPRCASATSRKSREWNR
jgi:hypothetical protein